ncbi:hypothetical protein SARC_00243 [Sphaeroforma arctica JP610]|uniref:PNPLA domain-containing protein n=1 Tax=Sphaeroforma arctica JP610 TaxID=667725 RepID=A0A0L0GF95_9EUKA|nr:hypothetical protein SARC_00243 [Sphaeroforma arctica JP610]KNC87672.1 hypothetical protein SARC_00243 [Sphaeroforma arctica JP610]|eukprot:XP_014161574.1 hypothetical protein SARC_00243 [Sphaeroforma arctica JP610]
MGLIISLIVYIYEDLVRVFSPRDVVLDNIKDAMTQADSYKDWKNAASDYDRRVGNDKWRREEKSDEYDYQLIRRRLDAIQDAMDKDDIEALVYLLRSGLVRGLGGMSGGSLQLHAMAGTKDLIEEYIDTMCTAIKHLSQMPDNFFAPITKQRFFTDMRQAYGRSALLLSGGSALGLHHFGVIKCMHEAHVLPKIICGASIGALLTGLLAVHTTEELPRLFEPDALTFEAFERLGPGSARRKIKRFLKHGHLMDVDRLQEFCISNIGNYTFLEAYHRTFRPVNIAVVGKERDEVPWLLNYLTAPNVLIWSAAVASCAMPGVFAPVDILAKDHEGNIVKWNPSKHYFSDLSLENDLPMTRLSELFNVNHFIVSQVNPHVVPFLNLFMRYDKDKFHCVFFFEKVRDIVMSELHHLAINFSILVPRSFNFFQHALSQKYVADITITPELSYDTDLKNLLRNPSEDLCRHSMLRGERSTYKYLPQIEICTKIETCLEDCLREFRHASDARKASKDDEPSEDTTSLLAISAPYDVPELDTQTDPYATPRRSM